MRKLRRLQPQVVLGKTDECAVQDGRDSVIVAVAAATDEKTNEGIFLNKMSIISTRDYLPQLYIFLYLCLIKRLLFTHLIHLTT